MNKTKMSNEEISSDYVKNLLSYDDMSHDERINLRGHLVNILNQQSDGVIELRKSKELLRKTALNIIKWIPDSHVVPKDREHLKFLVNDK